MKWRKTMRISPSSHDFPSTVMKGLLQRVSQASVVNQDTGETLGAIQQGVLLLVGVQRQDTEAEADKLLHRVLNYRIFSDAQGKMNNSLLDVGGGLLIVSQFTLAADTSKGLRPGFSVAAAPELGETLYNYLVQQAATQVPQLGTGRFGANMAVSLVNDGPVTFLLEV